MNLVRHILCALWFFGGCLVLSGVALIPSFRFDITHLYGRWLCPVALWILGIELVVRHRERLSTSAPCVLVPNHQHLYDVFIIGSLLEPKTIAVGKKSLRWVPVFGWLFRWTGNLYIDRGVSEKALEVMAEARRQIIEHGSSVVIAPEGTRSRGRGLLPFKKGAFHLAVRTGLPLQPIVISSFYGKLALHKRHAGRVLVDLLEPIPTGSVAPAQIPDLVAATHAQMKAAIAALDAELGPQEREASSA